MKYVIFVIFALASGILILLSYLIYKECTAETFELKKADWKCAKSHTERYTTMLMVGKVMMPQYHTRTVCDRWERK